MKAGLKYLAQTLIQVLYYSSAARRLIIAYKIRVGSVCVHPFDKENSVCTSAIIGNHILFPSIFEGKEIRANHDYAGCVPNCVRLALGQLPGLDGFVFYDLGCGMGRALIIASEFNFKDIIGVELSEELCSIARNNCGTIEDRCRNGESICVQNKNVIDVKFIQKKIVVFLYFPFSREITELVVANLVEAISNGSQVFLIFENPVYYDIVDRSRSFTRLFASQTSIPLDQRQFHFDQESEAIIIWMSNNIGAGNITPSFEVLISKSGRQATINFV